MKGEGNGKADGGRTVKDRRDELHRERTSPSPWPGTWEECKGELRINLEAYIREADGFLYPSE